MKGGREANVGILTLGYGQSKFAHLHKCVQYTLNVYQYIVACCTNTCTLDSALLVYTSAYVN